MKTRIGSNLVFVFRYAILWCLYTSFTPVLFLLFYGLAFAFLILEPAIFFGFIQAIFFLNQKGQFGSEKDLKIFSTISGAIFGLLCNPLIYWMHPSWSYPYVLMTVLSYAVLSLCGAYASERNIRYLLSLVNAGKKTAWKKIINSYSILVGSLFLVELIIICLCLRNVYPNEMRLLQW